MAASNRYALFSILYLLSSIPCLPVMLTCVGKPALLWLFDGLAESRQVICEHCRLVGRARGRWGRGKHRCLDRGDVLIQLGRRLRHLGTCRGSVGQRATLDAECHQPIPKHMLARLWLAGQAQWPAARVDDNPQRAPADRRDIRYHLCAGRIAPDPHISGWSQRQLSLAVWPKRQAPNLAMLNSDAPNVPPNFFQL